jgi:hypothetical protein
VMACAVKMLDAGGLGTLPDGVRLKQTKLHMEALLQVRLSCTGRLLRLNPPSDVIHAIVRPTKDFRVSKSATFARG